MTIPRNAIFLAPMAGVTDAPFRDLVCSFGANAVVSEMIASEALVRNNRKTYRRLSGKKADREADGGRSALQIFQIMGADPENMAQSAVINEEFGADIIDINMGCPAKKVSSNGSGVALMKNEDLAVEIAKSVVKAVKIPVTVKMRLGWNSENINCFTLAKKLEDIGVSMIAVHCRTGSQMYSGSATPSLLEKMREIVQIPYICNGDIKSIEDATRVLRQSKANGVMIGRAALGKPWLLRQIMDFMSGADLFPTPSLEDQFKIIVRHFHATLGFYGEFRGIRIFRKHFCWYSMGLNGASTFRETINRSDDISFIEKYVENFYEKCFLLETAQKDCPKKSVFYA
jgi:tRNA-dihydrouridine synthase B